MKSYQTIVLMVFAMLLGVFSVPWAYHSGPLVTGSAVYTTVGSVNYTITSVVSIVMVNETLDFGAFYVNDSCGNCVADTNGNVSSACCVGAHNVTEGFSIENQGNRNLSIFLNFSTNASGFIGGSGPSFKYVVKPDSDPTYGGQIDDSVAACGGVLSPSSWTEVNTSVNYICGDTTSFPLSPANNMDNIVIHLLIDVPNDAVGKNSVGISLTGSAAS